MPLKINGHHFHATPGRAGHRVWVSRDLWQWPIHHGGPTREMIGSLPRDTRAKRHMRSHTSVYGKSAGRNTSQAATVGFMAPPQPQGLLLKGPCLLSRRNLQTPKNTGAFGGVRAPHSGGCEPHTGLSAGSRTLDVECRQR